MLKQTHIILTLVLMLAPQWLMAETVSGTLRKVSFAENYIQVDQKTWEVNTESTRVIYRGEDVGEESLRPGDRVELIISDEPAAGQRRDLHMVILLRGRKSGLDS